jgi:hypothetical protein
VISTEPSRIFSTEDACHLKSSSPHSIVLDLTRCFHLANATVLMRACPGVTKRKAGLPSALFEGPRSKPGLQAPHGCAIQASPRRAANLHRKRAQVVSHLNLTKIRRATFGCCVVEIVFD